MTIVVVGHGRSPEGRAWGRHIDSCCTVIRMWDWTPWQGYRDYGEKYDYGLFVLTPKQLPVFIRDHTTTPNKAWLAYLGKPTTGVLPHDRPVFLIDPSPIVELGQQMGGAGLSGRLTLTRGTVAASWAIAKAKRGDMIILVGFDNVYAKTNAPVEESFCPEYWKMFNDRFEEKPDKYYPTGQPKTETHDMTIELPLLQELAREADVNLVSAGNVWS